MQLTQSFFQSLDDWIDTLEVDANLSFDCPDSECTGDCSLSCILAQDSDFPEESYVDSESYIWCSELIEKGGLQ